MCFISLSHLNVSLLTLLYVSLFALPNVSLLDSPSCSISHPSIYLFIYPSIHLHVHPHIHPSTHSSIHPSIHTHPHIHDHLIFYLSIFLFRQNLFMRRGVFAASAYKWDKRTRESPMSHAVFFGKSSWLLRLSRISRKREMPMRRKGKMIPTSNCDHSSTSATKLVC